MFVCDEWRDSTYSRKEDGKAIARLVYSDSFWEGVAEVCSVSEPLVKVLRLVDSDQPTRAICMRPWIGPKKLSGLIMWERVATGFKDRCYYGI